MQQEQTVKYEQISSDRQDRVFCLSRVAACLSRMRGKKAGRVLKAATIEQMQSPEVIVTLNCGLKFWDTPPCVQFP